MRRLRLFLVLTAGAAALLLFPLGSFGGTAANTWSGTWNTNFGTMTLVQSGASVRGSYGHDQGKITGTIAGDVLSGTWSEAPTYAGPKDAGPFKWTLAAGGKSWSGTWQYAGGGGGGDWSGTCTGGACLNNGQASRCKRPKRVSSRAAQRDGRPAGASAKCEVTVNFFLLHGGWPKGKPKAFIDVTTNAIGTVSFDFDSDEVATRSFHTPRIEPNDITVRVVRTIHVIEDVPTPTPKKARLVFRARGPRPLIKYVENVASRGLIVPLDLVSSNDPECPAGAQALLTLIDDRPDDRFTLQIPCAVHRGSFVNQGEGRKPLVRVVLRRK